MKQELSDRDDKYKNVLEEQDELVKELSSKIQELKITGSQKADLESRISSLSGRTIQSLIMPDFNIVAKAIANLTFPTPNPYSIIAAAAAAQLSTQLRSVEPQILPSPKKKEGKTKTIEVVKEDKKKEISPVKKTLRTRKIDKKS